MSRQIKAKVIIAACGGPVVVSKNVKRQYKATDKKPKPITPQAISQWDQIPSQYCIQLEALCEYTRHQMRPDIFGPEPSHSGNAA